MATFFNYTYPTWAEATTWVGGLEMISEGREAVSFQKAKQRGNPAENFFVQLREILKEVSSIRAINLSWAYIGDTNAAILADGIQENQSLLSLFLNDCCIGDEGAQALASALRQNKSLLYLALWKNSIGEAGMYHFSQALSENISGNYNKTLKKLSLTASNVAEMEYMGKIQTYLSINKKKQKKAYLDAFKNSGAGEASWKRTRLMLVGQGKAGKTALVRSFLDMPFQEKWESTIGVQLTQTEMTMKPKRTIWSAIKEKTKMYHTAGLAARLAVTQLLTPSAKSGSKANIDRKNSYGRVGGENDKRSNTFVENKDIQEVRENFNDNLMTKAREDNAVNTLTCSIWDYGGQHVFYTVHHLFLTGYGVYMLVFNMKELQTETENEERYLLFWLNSIKMHAEGAPVFLVGTFKDMVDSKETLLDIDTILKNLIGKKYPQVIHNLGDKLVYFPVSNRTGEGVMDLRESAIEIATQQEHAKISVKMRWMLCLDNFERLSLEEPWLRLSKVQEIARAAGISDHNEVQKMLHLYHQLGMVVHLTSTQTLADVVVTNPQWLLNSISLVIRDSEIHSFERMDELENAGLKEDVERLFTRGLVSRDLLLFLWDREQVNFLLDLMKHTMLLSEWDFGSEDNLYLVPSLLKDRDSNNRLEGLECFLDFSEDYLPIGTFQRLICLCVTHSSRLADSAEPTLAHNYAKLSFGSKTELELIKEPNKIRVIFENDLMAATCLMIVSSMLVKLKEDVLGRLSWKVMLQHGEGGEFIAYDEAREKKIEPWFINIRELKRSKNYKDIDVNEFLSLMRETYNAEEKEELEYAVEKV